MSGPGAQLEIIERGDEDDATPDVVETFDSADDFLADLEREAKERGLV